MSMVPGMSWKISALRKLSESSLRVFTAPELDVWLASEGFDIPVRTARRALQEWEMAGLVERVATGIYLNKQLMPLPLPEEAARKLRPGAIVSLGTVLGRAGVLNNPIHWVTAVVPSSDSNSRREVSMDSGSNFQFAQVRPDLLTSTRLGWGRDALEAHAAVPTATPEKAVLDWVYLASSPRGAARWALPPAHDWDISSLDEDRLSRLAAQMGLEPELAQFQAALEGDKPRISVRRMRP
jgi:hypothetical protein